MTNPFDDPDGRFLVLADAEGRHSLWPTFAGVPEGWTVVKDEDTRAAAVEYVERNWTDPRPRPLTDEDSAEALAPSYVKPGDLVGGW